MENFDFENVILHTSHKLFDVSKKEWQMDPFDLNFIQFL